MQKVWKAVDSKKVSNFLFRSARLGQKLVLNRLELPYVCYFRRQRSPTQFRNIMCKKNYTVFVSPVKFINMDLAGFGI